MNNKELYKETILLKKRGFDIMATINCFEENYNMFETLLQDYNNLCQQFCYELGQKDIKGIHQ